MDSSDSWDPWPSWAWASTSSWATANESPFANMPGIGDPGVYSPGHQFTHQPEEFSVETEEFSMVSEEFSDGCPVECDPARCVDGRCEGGSELFVVVMVFFIGLPILGCLYHCLKGREQIENLEMIGSEDEVIKTYQIGYLK